MTPIHVLVTDAGGNHALAAIRSLGRHGLRVAAADGARGAMGLFSRHCAARAVYPSPRRGTREFLAGLRLILRRLRPRVVMPMTERTIMALLSDRDGVEPGTMLAPLPSPEAIEIAFDKLRTIDLARSLGVPAPATWAPADPREIEALSGRLSYPVAIKPRRSEIATAEGRIVPGGRAAYCFDAAGLPAVYLEVHRRAPLPLIQEFIPGEGYGISVLCDRGRVRALFAHRRLRMIRPTGSGSTLRESIAPPPAMEEAARALMRALAWHGVAMVEFKRDARDGVFSLMEINGRFWNSLPLAIASGVDFPYLLYRLATEGQAPECLQYRLGVRCRWLLGDLGHLLEVWRGRPAGWPDRFPSRLRTLRDVLTPFGRDLHYDDLWISDPLPFFAAALGLLPGQIAARRERGRAFTVREAPYA
jgi:ATP-grasp in the biosynthetic pathway with Ter operon